MSNNPATDNGLSVKKVPDQKMSMTYQEVANAFIESAELKNTDEIAGVKLFAEHLDGNNVMSHQLTLLALQQARKIDRETILALVEALGMEKSQEIVRAVVEKHRHTKICQDEAVPVKDEPKKEDEQKETK